MHTSSTSTIMHSPQMQPIQHRTHTHHATKHTNGKPDIRRAHNQRHHTKLILELYNGISNTITRNIQVIILFVGLVITALVQPLFVTFMVLLWIGDETFRSYFLKDIMSLVTLGNPTGTVFELLMKWSTITFFCCIVFLLVCVTAYLKWKDQQGRGILSLIASTDFSNKLKPYFIVYYSAWLLIYWFEITVIFFGYLGKLMLMLSLTLRGGEEIEKMTIEGTASNSNTMMMMMKEGASMMAENGSGNSNSVMMDVNAEHNFIGLCVLVLFVIVITIADFVIQDIFNVRTTTTNVRECQRQE